MEKREKDCEGLDCKDKKAINASYVGFRVFCVLPVSTWGVAEWGMVAAS